MKFIGDPSLDVKTLGDVAVEGLLDSTAGPSAGSSGPMYTADVALFFEEEGSFLTLLSDVDGLANAKTPYGGDELFLQRAVPSINGAVASNLTFTVTPAGTVQASGAGTVPLQFSVTAAGVVGKSSGSTVGLQFAVTATGVVGVGSGVSVPLTATITSAGSTGLSTGSSVPLTFSVTADGTVTSGLSP